jgi:hypothetical protein
VLPIVCRLCTQWWQALRIRDSRQLWSALNVVPGEQCHTKLMAEVLPGGITGSSLRCQYSHNVIMAETSKTMTISQDLA